MERFKEILLLVSVILANLLAGPGCNPLEEFPAGSGANNLRQPWAVSEISGSCIVDMSEAPLATKAMVGQSTTQSMSANFLRIDEAVGADNLGTYDFSRGSGQYNINWAKAYLLESSVTATPDKDYLRSVYFDPVQTYSIYEEKVSDVSERFDTTFYHTRMVGWYPLNCRLPRNDSDKAVSLPVDDERYSDFFYEEEVPGTEDNTSARKGFSVKFTGLDGSVDLMLSDVREGQYWHEKGSHPESDGDDGSRYSPPFGHFMQGDEFLYRNAFTFKHYLTAVRVWVYADQSPQNISMWGEVVGVSFPAQPTSCKISIPDEISVSSADGSVFGVAYDWDDPASIDIVTDPMYGDDGGNDGDFNLSAEFPVSLEGTNSSSMAYLGYAMLRPDTDITLGIHTTSGVYYVTVESDYKYKGPDGTDQAVDIFKAGYIYDIRLNLQTEGTIAALLENEHDLRFFDLSTFEEYEENSSLGVYKYANCYVVDPDAGIFQDAQGAPKYDGFCFSATVIGNGEAGILPPSGNQQMHTSSAVISPAKARLIWESSPGLVSQIELLYGYVRFRVSDPTAHGNAVIGVYDDAGKVLWSWHIWMPDSTLEEMAETVTLETGNSITILDRNLGAEASVLTGAADNDLKTYGLYYQWGRKDPSMGPKSADYRITSLETADYYDFSMERKNAAEVKTFAEPSIRDGVENPMYLVLPTSRSRYYEFNWLYNDIGFLWGKQEDVSVIHKTIYDPCPFGYRVPDSELQTLFDESDLTSYQGHGQVLSLDGKNLYFPYAGYKGVDKGLNSVVASWRYVGSKGDYQTARYYTGGDGDLYHHRERYYLSEDYSWKELNVGTYTGYQVHDYTNRRTAASVRCVKDEDIGSIVADIYPTSRLLVPDKEFSLTWYVNSSGSILTDIKIDAVYTRNGVDESRPVWYSSESGETLSLTYRGSRSYTVSAADLAGFDDGSMRFILTAENSYGLTARAFCRVATARMGINKTAWQEQLDNNVYYVGQNATLEFRLNGNIPNPEIYINKAVADDVEITGSDQTGYIYTVTYQYTIQPGENTFVIAGYYEGKQMVVGTEAERTLSLTPNTTKILSTAELSDPDAVYIITTADGRVLDGSSSGDVRILPSGSHVTESNGFKISGSGDSFSFQSLATEKYINTANDWLGIPDRLIMGGDREQQYHTGTVADGGGFQIYTNYGVSYYWTEDNDGISCNRRSGDSFYIYKLNE